MIDFRPLGVLFGENPGEREVPFWASPAVVVRVTKEMENVKAKEIRTFSAALHYGFFILH
jgi:hypothetical protein